MSAANIAADGGCKNCITTKIYQLDTLVVDEHGMDVWARILAKRYRAHMEQFIRLKDNVSNFLKQGRNGS